MAQGLKPRIVTIKGIKADANKITYQLESTTSSAGYLTPNIPHKLKDVTLMIDCWNGDWGTNVANDPVC